ncbi:MAG: TonB-dependent receptor [Bryobacterales bacterium]|nr:TonB-dependent receptor [Bryobacterales bacterium]
MRNQPFQEVQLKFRRAGLFVLAKACLAGLLCAPLVSGQTLSVTVVDPFSDAVTNATVAIGDVEVPTDDSGVAIFSGLGDGPHSVVVIAPDFAAAVREVTESEGSVTIKLQLQVVSEVIDVEANVGTRSTGVQPLESSVPVELVLGERLRSTGQLETGRALQMQAPSFNFSSSTISDGTDALRPATLRGLGPDQTLVLVNGKRRHNSALLHVNTSVGRGTAGTDMNAIPIAAVERIEVLRDGAAAQYGSDAIAGVINVVLKDSPGFTMDTAWGQTYAGDGDALMHSMHGGWGSDSGGFLNLTFESRDRDRTNRAGWSARTQYPLVDCALDAPYAIGVGSGNPGAGTPGRCFDPREYGFNRKNFRTGDADSEQYSMYYNAGVPLGKRASFYTFGGWTHRDNQSTGFYRRANVSNTVLEFYPDGFLPEINTEVSDLSFVTGIDYTSVTGWNLDLSMSHGRNTFDFLITNSNNATYGIASPRQADSGGPRFDQTAFNFDVSREFEGDGRTTNFAFGTEFRRDRYGIRAGEPFSYLNCKDDPKVEDKSMCVSAPAGIQVFPGFQRNVNEGRTNIGAYGDVEFAFESGLKVGMAGRLERYSDFGASLTGKLSVRYDFNPVFALRGSVNTGFRAPSLHQLHFTNVSTQFVTNAAGETVSQERGTYPNNSSVAKALGIPDLKQERSVNFSGGAVARISPTTSLTVDAFRVSVQDRIVISGSFTASKLAGVPEAIAGLDAVNATAAQFFTNAAETVTSGLEFSFSSLHTWRNGSVLDFGVSGMLVNTELVGGVDAPTLLAGLEDTIFGGQDRSILTEWQPNTRVQGMADYSLGPFKVGGALRYFGSYWVQEGGSLGERPCGASGFSESPIGGSRQQFCGKVVTDVHVGFRVFKHTELTVGAQNLLNTVPDQNHVGQTRNGRLEDSSGRVIIESPGVFVLSRRAAPFGFNGGFYYARLSVRF